MKTGPLVAIIILIILALFVAWWAYEQVPTSQPATSSATSTVGGVPVFDQSISDGTFKISFPNAVFGLAVNPTQVLVHSYIPPCNQNFNYCLYYIGSTYSGSNFESAGIRIEKRADLKTERLCLNTPPEGFTSAMTPAATTSTDAYSASTFPDVGGAAAGHFAHGSLYRLFVRNNSSCYEFETRIGQSQFANYPSGTIREFTPADEAVLQAQMQKLLGTLTLATSGQSIIFPQSR